MIDAVSMSAIVFVVLVGLSAIGALTVTHRLRDWVEARLDPDRLHCGYHEALERIREAIGLPPRIAHSTIADEAIRIIREPILSLAADPYKAEAVDVLEISYDVRALWGRCDVCGAGHGMQCRNVIDAGLFREGDRGVSAAAHFGRLAKAPLSVRLEWSRARLAGKA